MGEAAFSVPGKFIECWMLDVRCWMFPGSCKGAPNYNRGGCAPQNDARGAPARNAAKPRPQKPFAPFAFFVCDQNLSWNFNRLLPNLTATNGRATAPYLARQI